LLERDLLIEQHKIHYKGAVEGGVNTFRRFAMGSEKAKIAAFLRCFGATVRDKVVLYTPKPSEYCGAFLVPLGPVLQRFEELLALDGDVLEIARHLNWSFGVKSGLDLRACAPICQSDHVVEVIRNRDKGQISAVIHSLNVQLEPFEPASQAGCKPCGMHPALSRGTQERWR
jgi:hypothetical protein